jgi:hypothetical protein
MQLQCQQRGYWLVLIHHQQQLLLAGKLYNKNYQRICFVFIYRGLDNKLTLYPLSTDDEANKHKKVVATHANYISACKFMHSDQQVRITNRMHFKYVWHGILLGYLLSLISTVHDQN